MAVFHKKKGAGLFDVFSTIKNFVSDNKDSIKDIVGGVKDIASNAKSTHDTIKEIRGIDDKILNVAEEVKTDEILKDLMFIKELKQMKQGKGFNYI